MVEFYIVPRLVAALLAGGLIGVERNYHGRAAGVRTYALVCLGSTLVIVVTSYPELWAINNHADTSDGGLTRVIQGIVTGIGFLGAGVIVKEGLSVRGLTTAASIWVTAGIGVLVGVGFYVTASAATLLTLATLSVFRSLEGSMPAQSYLHCYVRFPADNLMPEEALRTLVTEQGFKIAELAYKLSGEPRMFEYRMVVWSENAEAGRRLAEALTSLESATEFRVAPSKD